MSYGNVSTLLKKDWEQWMGSRDQMSCDNLMKAYLPLVEYHVQRIGANLPKNVVMEDLRSNGMLGLYDALEKFDHKRELKFDTYASFRIRGAIIDGLRQEDWLPRTVREKTKRIEKAVEVLEQQHGRYVTSLEVADHLGIKETEVLQSMNESFIANQLSIDEPVHDSNREESYSTSIEDKKTLTPEGNLDKKLQIEELVSVIKTLTDKEQMIIHLFYFEELTLTEIGEILKLSTSRISQIHSRILFKLQQRFSNK
ncbi:FliA/WhiG family RNA polymerase sigma factor [Evansella sp. AB-rgal1]|uniref:FliA/WhiG family RNA polymerase sigma factor n=1 Tax=Evansella sp. AB-rgal1 TaxID=3242696 RepID=UPI00359D2822